MRVFKKLYRFAIQKDIAGHLHTLAGEVSLHMISISGEKAGDEK